MIFEIPRNHFTESKKTAMTATGSHPLAQVPLAPPDVMFGLSAAYRADQDPNKVDIGVGAYRHEDGKPWVLPSVQQARQKLLSDPSLNHEYLPIEGLAPYLTASQRLVFGASSPALTSNKIASVQTTSGTGALHLASLFLSRFLPAAANTVYVSNPPYANHLPILRHAALQTDLYPYYDPQTKSIDFAALQAKLQSIPDGSTVLLHVCAHNPTGTDLSQDQWKTLSQIMKSRHLIPFFDSAYQGFASGDPESDAWPVRFFVEQDFPVLLVAQSYAKNFGLYGERVGCLHVVTSEAELTKNVFSQLRGLQRVTISTPPAFGARVVAQVLGDKELSAVWRGDLKTMAGRIMGMRKALRAGLEELGTPGDWSHLTSQIGMFCYSGLTAEQVDEMREKWHVYMTRDGRMSVAGLNEGNVGYVARAIGDVVGGKGS